MRPECDACGLELHHHRADDLPPYLVIFIVAHIVGYLILETESAYDVPLWVELGVWPVFTLPVRAGLLQPVKGAVVGLQYALGMHGFATLPRSRPAAGPEETRLADCRSGSPRSPQLLSGSPPPRACARGTPPP